jgi:hypothetical protein
MHCDLGSAQILTQHYGAKSQTASQLMSSRTTPTRQVPVVQPLWVIEAPVDGVCACAMHPPDKADRIVGFISL